MPLKILRFRMYWLCNCIIVYLINNTYDLLFFIKVKDSINTLIILICKWGFIKN